VAGLLAVLLPGSPVTGPGGAQRIQTAAYVTRVERALSQPGQANVVGYARTILPPRSTPVLMANGLQVRLGPGASSPWSVRTLVQWTYQDTHKISAFTATGRRIFDQRLTAAAGGQAAVTVIYRDATWWRAAPTGAQGPVPQRCGPGVEIGAGGWPAFIRFELSCGEYTTDGRQRVSGVDAIKLTGDRGLAALWVDPKTYLPVRVMFAFGRRPTQTDFRWLRPTSASLASLNLPVPAGFRQVPPPA
jgi:hypothetical protein